MEIRILMETISVEYGLYNGEIWDTVIYGDILRQIRKLASSIIRNQQTVLRNIFSVYYGELYLP